MSHKQLTVAQVLAGAPIGGAENFYLRLVQSLAKQPEIRQHAFVRHTEIRESALRESQVDATWCRFGGALDLLDHWQYRRKLQALHPDIVLTWMSRASGLTPAGDYTLVNRLGHYYNLKYYRQADYWVGISKGICDHLIQGGMPLDKVVYIPNFADESPVTALPRTAFATPEGVPLLLAAGRLHTNKGFDVLLDAMQQVPTAYLWLAGAGPEETALKQLAEQGGVADRVRFLGWRRDVTALMATADMFICPSRHEGLGSIILESWAHGCPQIAARSQGPGELIRHDEDGLVVEIDDSDGLAQAINRLLASESLRQDLAAAGLERYRQEFSRAIITRQYVDFFQSIAVK